MSEAARVPFTETKAPESAERLHRGALGLVDTATPRNIMYMAPAVNRAEKMIHGTFVPV